MPVLFVAIPVKLRLSILFQQRQRDQPEHEKKLRL